MAYLAPTNGTPADNFGADGDTTVDYTGKFFYGPKGQITAGSWTGTAKSIVGPTGPTGPAVSSLQTLPALAKVYGTAAVWNAFSSNATYQPLYFPGTTFAHTFTPNQDSALTNVQMVNFGATGANAFVQLVNVGTGAVIYNSGALASGSINNADFTNTQYSLTKGTTYQWQATRGTSGSISVYVIPTYLSAAASTTALSFFPNAVIPSSVTAASGSNVAFQSAGISGQQQYYRAGIASYVYSATIRATGSGNVAFYMQNDANNANLSIAAAATTLSSTPQDIVLGPFSSSQFPLAANTTYSMRLFASGTAINVTMANLVMQIGI